MSIILSGLIHIFRPLLSSLSGALDCKGVGPWYFLLGLRIVAIFFSNGPWDKMKEDVACNWDANVNERSREFCRTLCHNQYFPISVAATWGLVFLVVLLLTGLMRLTSPRRKQKRKEAREKEKEDKGLAIVETAPHGSTADMSTVYMVGRRGLPRRYRHHPRRSTLPHHLHGYADWPHRPHWHGTYVARMAGGYGTDMGFVPCEDGGYGMPTYPEHVGQTKMSDDCYDMTQHKTSACPTDVRQTKMSTHSSGTDQYGMPPFQSHMKQTHVAPYCGETEQYNVPTKCSPVSISSSPYKGKMVPQCWPVDEHEEPFQQRYKDPEECGAGESTDHGYMMGTRARYTSKGKMPPRYCEDGRYSMATKCKTVTESNMGHIALHPGMDDQANMAIKRRPVQGSKMHTKHHVTFDASGRADMGFGSNTCAQPWMPTDSNCIPIGGKNIMTGPSVAPGPTLCYHGDAAHACAETCDPCHVVASQCEPQGEPCCHDESAHGRHRHSETSAGPQDQAKMSITKICGIPLFDLWVALLLASEICFLCAIMILQMPKLSGRLWTCSPAAVNCPQSVQCTVKARAEKRVALWGLAFTSLLFIIACCGYFNLRFCWNKRCRQMCGEDDKERREEECAEDTEHEACVVRGDVEGGHERNNTHGL